jgi:ribosomal protein L37AE/L43A
MPVEIREIVVTTKTSKERSSFGMTCEKCGEALIAPDWSEHVSEQLVINLWSCPKCGCEFETEACMPAHAMKDDTAIKANFPSLLVA